jgi:hypothetical protein
VRCQDWRRKQAVWAGCLLVTTIDDHLHQVGANKVYHLGGGAARRRQANRHKQVVWLALHAGSATRHLGRAW